LLCLKDKLDSGKYLDAKKSADESLRKQLGFMANTREQTAEALDELVDADLQHITFDNDSSSYFAQTVNQSCPEMESMLEWQHQMHQAFVLSTATMPVVGLNDIGSDTDLVDYEDVRTWSQQGLVVTVIKLPRPKPLTGIGSNYNPIKTSLLTFTDHSLGLEPQLFEVAKTNRVTIFGARFQALHDVETRPETRSMRLHRTGNSIAKVGGEYHFIKSAQHEPKIVPLHVRKGEALSAARIL